MPVLLSTAVLCVGAILQSTLLPHLAVLGVKVDLVLLLVAGWSIRRGIEAGLIWALIGGIALDVMSAGPFGLSIVAFSTVAVIAGGMGPGMRRSSILLPLALIPLVSAVATLVGALVMQSLGRQISWPIIVATVVLPSAILDTLGILIVYPLLSIVDHRLNTVEWPN